MYLNDNILSDIGRGTFGAMTRIGTIDLARNKITKIDYQMFAQLNYVEVSYINAPQIIFETLLVTLKPSSKNRFSISPKIKSPKSKSNPSKICTRPSSIFRTMPSACSKRMPSRTALTLRSSICRTIASNPFRSVPLTRLRTRTNCNSPTISSRICRRCRCTI